MFYDANSFLFLKQKHHSIFYVLHTSSRYLISKSTKCQDQPCFCYFSHMLICNSLVSELAEKLWSCSPLLWREGCSTSNKPVYLSASVFAFINWPYLVISLWRFTLQAIPSPFLILGCTPAVLYVWAGIAPLSSNTGLSDGGKEGEGMKMLRLLVQGQHRRLPGENDNHLNARNNTLASHNWSFYKV